MNPSIPRLKNILRELLDTLDPSRQLIDSAIRKSRKASYGDYHVSPGEAANTWLRQGILSGQPFAAGKFGATEARLFGDNLRRVRSGRKISKLMRGEIYLHSGVFPTDDIALNAFCELYARDAAEVDLLGVWYRRGEAPLIRASVTPLQRNFVGLRGLEPYYFPDPWSHALEGKQVLVVSPFKTTIERQYERRKAVWPGGLLPDFDLRVLRFPHSRALVGEDGPDGHFRSWREIYDQFCEQMSNVPFDVALVGAGAATLPLAVHARRLGRQGIGLGGSLQILFGIMGRRWDRRSSISQLVNENWTRPSGDEVPQKRMLMENGAYW